MKTERPMLAVLALLTLGGVIMLCGLGAFVLFNASGSYAIGGACVMAAFYLAAALLLVTLIARQKRSR